MRIDRCVCFGRRFAELRALAEATGAGTAERLAGEARAAGAPFGLRCGLCRPYVARMLRTGETVFHEVVREEDERGMGGPGR